MRNCSTKSSPTRLDTEKKSAPVPETGDIPSIAAQLKSLVRNTLLASPDFPRLYADVLISEGYNPNQARILAGKYQRNFHGANMPVQSNVKTCTHIKVTGIRCGSPALRGEQFCYFHQRMVRGVPTPRQARLHPIALIEDEESIQAALMEVLNALMRNTIELKRAALILRALHIAVKNARRVRFQANESRMVKEVPDFAAPSDAPAVPQRTEFDLPYAAAIPDPPARKETFWDRWYAGKEQPDPTQRKPPASAKQAEAPQQGKAAKAATSG